MGEERNNASGVRTRVSGGVTRFGGGAGERAIGGGNFLFEPGEHLGVPIFAERLPTAFLEPGAMLAQGLGVQGDFHLGGIGGLDPRGDVRGDRHDEDKKNSEGFWHGSGSLVLRVHRNDGAQQREDDDEDDHGSGGGGKSGGGGVIRAGLTLAEWRETLNSASVLCVRGLGL